MAEIAGDILIDRPVEEVFDFVANECNEPKYNPEMMQSFKVTNGPIGTGTRFAVMQISAGRPVGMTVEVTEYDRPHRLASRTVMSWAEVRGVLTFDAAGAGTRMRWTWKVRPKGFAGVMAPIVGVIGRRRERAVWEGLKRYLEAHRSEGAHDAAAETAQEDREHAERLGSPASSDDVEVGIRGATSPRAPAGWDR